MWLASGRFGVNEFPILSPEPAIVIEMPPVSLQGSPQGRQRIKGIVRDQAAELPVIFTGEVEVQIEWLLHESRKWDRPGVLTTPDLDNIIKPLMDGLCGPSGILIDDCQVQSLVCSWIDWPDPQAQQVTVRVRSLLADEYMTKGRILGVESDDRLCWIIDDELPAEGLLMLVEFLKKNRADYEELIQLGIAEDRARYLLSQARRFRREHLLRHGFEVVEVGAYLDRVKHRLSGT